KAVQGRTNGKYHPHRSIKRASGIVKYALEQTGHETFYQGTHTLRRAVARAYFDWLCTPKEDGGRGHPDVDALRMTSALLNHTLTSTTEKYLGIDLEREKRDRSL